MWEFNNRNRLFRKIQDRNPEFLSWNMRMGFLEWQLRCLYLVIVNDALLCNMSHGLVEKPHFPVNQPSRHAFLETNFSTMYTPSKKRN